MNKAIKPKYEYQMHGRNKTNMRAFTRRSDLSGAVNQNEKLTKSRGLRGDGRFGGRDLSGGKSGGSSDLAG